MGGAFEEGDYLGFVVLVDGDEDGVLEGEGRPDEAVIDGGGCVGACG